MGKPASFNMCLLACSGHPSIVLFVCPHIGACIYKCACALEPMQDGAASCAVLRPCGCCCPPAHAWSQHQHSGSQGTCWLHHACLIEVCMHLCVGMCDVHARLEQLDESCGLGQLDAASSSEHRCPSLQQQCCRLMHGTQASLGCA